MFSLLWWLLMLGATVLHSCRRSRFRKDATSRSRCVFAFVWLTGAPRTAGTTRLVINHASQAIKFKVAAVQQQLLQLFSCALHPRFCTREREPKAVGQIPLRKPL